MADDKELYPPFEFSPLWLVLGIVLLVAILGWYGWVFWSTRDKKQVVIKPQPIDLNTLKHSYLAAIHTVEVELQAGTTTKRRAHQELSRIIRTFVYEAHGSPTHVLTLAELRQGNSAVSHIIELYYPQEFHKTPEEINPIDSVAHARQLVTQWR